MEVEPRAGSPASTAYALQAANLIKTTWVHLVEQSTDLPYGKAVIHLSIDRHGKAFNPHVLPGDSNAALVPLGIRAIADTRLPEMSDDTIRELNGKRIGLDITFDVRPASYTNHKPMSR